MSDQPRSRNDPRLTDGSAGREELSFEVGLRPRRLAEYVGQEQIKSNLGVFLEAARSGQVEEVADGEPAAEAGAAAAPKVRPAGKTADSTSR